MSAELQPDAIDEEHLQLRMLEAEIAREIAHHESEGGECFKNTP